MCPVKCIKLFAPGTMCRQLASHPEILVKNPGGDGRKAVGAVGVLRALVSWVSPGNDLTTNDGKPENSKECPRKAVIPPASCLRKHQQIQTPCGSSTKDEV